LKTEDLLPILEVKTNRLPNWESILDGCAIYSRQNDGRNVTLLSATPFTNKPLEYYSIFL
jgi:hypothetical protein